MANPKLEAILAYVPLFHDLSKREIKKIASLCDVGDYMAGAAVVMLTVALPEFSEPSLAR